MTRTTTSSPPAEDATHGGLRTVAWFLLLFAAAIFVAVVPIQRLLLRDVDDRVAATLVADVEDLRAEAGAVGPGGSEADLLEAFVAEQVPVDGQVLWAFHDGATVGAVPRAVADDLIDDQLRVRWSTVTDTEWGTVQRAVGEYRWVAVRVGDQGALVVAADVGTERSEVTDVLWLTVAAATVSLLAGAGLTWLLRPRPRVVASMPAPPPSSPPRPASGTTAPAVMLPVIDPHDTAGPDETDSDRLRLLGAADLTALLADAVRARFGDRQWRLADTASGDLVCDPVRVRHAVLDLAGYASAHAADEADLHIGSRDDNDAVVFMVAVRQAADQVTGDAAARRVVVANEGPYSMETDPMGRAVFSYSVPRRPPGGD